MVPSPFLVACLPGKNVRNRLPPAETDWICRGHLRSWVVFPSSSGCTCLLKCVSAGIAGSPSGGFVEIREKYPLLGRPTRKKHHSGCDHYQKKKKEGCTFSSLLKVLGTAPASRTLTEFRMHFTPNPTPWARCNLKNCILQPCSHLQTPRACLASHHIMGSRIMSTGSGSHHL